MWHLQHFRFRLQGLVWLDSNKMKHSACSTLFLFLACVIVIIPLCTHSSSSSKKQTINHNTSLHVCWPSPEADSYTWPLTQVCQVLQLCYVYLCDYVFVCVCVHVKQREWRKQRESKEIPVKTSSAVQPQAACSGLQWVKGRKDQVKTAAQLAHRPHGERLQGRGLEFPFKKAGDYLLLRNGTMGLHQPVVRGGWAGLQGGGVFSHKAIACSWFSFSQAPLPSSVTY